MTNDTAARGAALTQAQKALIAYAEAMLARGARVQYDDTRMIPAEAVKEYRWQRQTRQAESYTTQYPGYTNCAAFTHDVYYFGLGFDIGYWATDQLIVAGPAERVYYYEVTGTETDAEKAAMRAQFLAALRPADIIVYRRDAADNGHAMFYVGGGRIIHSTCPGGGSYDYAARAEKTEPDGSIDEMTTEVFFTPGTKRHFFNGLINRIAIVRPLNVWTGTVPRQSVDRMDNLGGVVAEKLCSHTVGQSVAPGEEMRCTIRIRNDNASPVTLEARDTLDEHVSLVSGCGDAQGGELSWTVTVPAGQTGSVEYAVRVSSDAPLGAKIGNDRAAVGGVTCPCPAVYVGRHLTAGEKAAVARAARNVSGGLRGWALAGKIYADAAGMDLAAILSSPQEVFAALFRKADVEGHFRFTDSAPCFAAVAPTMFGGRVVVMSPCYDRVRTRGPFLAQLETGDVAICTDDTGDAPAEGDCAMYLLAGEDSVLRLTGEAPALLTGDDAQAALWSLIAYKKFVILRPSALR